MKKKKKILIGVAWPYVNGELHPGHIAGCYLPSDIFARFKRLQGHEVLMLSGSDCFGTPITIQADKEGTTPKEVVEKYAPKTSSLLLDTYKITFDSFTKTDTEFHRKITQKFFFNLLKNGYIIKRKSEQYYSEKDNKFLPDRYVEGECSYCHAKEQRGDQCESCGRSLQVGELISPYAKLTKNPVTLKNTEHYYVDLSKFKDKLTKYIESKKQIWRPWVWKEAKAWIDELQPRAITRDIDWGVEIPIDDIKEHYPEYIIEGAENKRFYVWFDAVIGYFSEGIKWSLLEQNEFDNTLELFDPKRFFVFLNKFWQNSDRNLEHYFFVGKDNLFFHTLWWQSLLIGQEKEWGFELKLADNVPVNQFLNLEGQKFSKSRGVYINSTELVEKYSLDSVRFYLTSIMPENADANWKWDDFIDSVNAELNGNIGNFVHRTLTFYQNRLDGKIKDRNQVFEKFDNNDQIRSVLNKNKDVGLWGVHEEIQLAFKLNTGEDGFLNKCEFSNSLKSILDLSKFGNIYFNFKAPWKSLVENRDDCEIAIYNCMQIVNALRILLAPFLPDASDRLSEILGLEKLPSRPKENLNFENYFDFDANEFKKIKISRDIKPLFSKLEMLK